MANEGERPKVDGDVYFASETNDNPGNITTCETMIQTTKIVSGLGILDINYTFGDSDWGNYNSTHSGTTNANNLGIPAGSCPPLTRSWRGSPDLNNDGDLGPITPH